MYTVERDFEENFERLSKKYRGLKKEDLEMLNPEYSCVICKKVKTCKNSKLGCSCMDHEKTTEEEFSSWYTF
jgi:hypothetical protein